MQKILFFATLSLLVFPTAARANFEWVDTPGKYLDLKDGDRFVARYVYEAIDESTPERREATYKPFCHIYKWGSEDAFITKGPGGKYTHHRGIFYGFSKCSYTNAEGKSHTNIDTWHCRQAYEIHRKFLRQEAGKDSATFTAVIDWVDNEGNVFANEERTMTFSFKDKDVVVNFTSKLTPTSPSLHLDGDPQHAGFQFRASNEVNDKTAKQTYYIRPETGAAKPGATINWSDKNDTDATRNLPWKGMCFTLGDEQYTVAYLDRPDNPKPARFSERDYGRFGSYFVADVTPENPLTVNYRLQIRKGEMTAEEIAKFSDDFVTK